LSDPSLNLNHTKYPATTTTTKTPKRLNAAATPPTETPQTPPQPPLSRLSLAVANPVADAAVAVNVVVIDRLLKFLQRPTPE
jgi:hypothetical protein